jgi:predicted RNase H-like HicB family nuclease
MKPNVYIIQQKGQDTFFGFVSDCPAICAQADSIDAVQGLLKSYSKKYFDFMSNNLIVIKSNPVVTL